MTDEQPVERFQAGRITCELFKHDMEAGGQLCRVLTAVLRRRYRDQWGNWKSEFEFRQEDISAAIDLLKQAFVTMDDRHARDQIELALERAASGTLPQNAKSPAA